MAKESVPIETLKLLCDYDGEKYVSKRGKEYIRALSRVFDLTNANDIPFTEDEITSQPLLKDFSFPGVRDFSFICNLQARPMEIVNGKRKNEKILASNFVSDRTKEVFSKSLGITYIITCTIDDKEYVIKIGSSRTTFAKRLRFL